jgi:hypothetical protein
MSPRSKKEYLERIFPRYKKAKSKEQKTQIIDELCEICKYHRKHAIRLLTKFKRFTKPKPRKRGKPSMYNQPPILDALERIWKDASMPCSKRFVTIIPLWLPHYPGGLNLPVIKALKHISAPTIDRVLKPVRKKYNRINISTTKPGTLLRKQIPIKTNQWEEFRPGFLEADTVAHCGTSPAGEYAHTVDFVDIATGWTEQRAVWSKGETQVLEQIKDVEESLPFPLRGFDSDNGGEFLNHHLLRHFTDNPERKLPVSFTRSRAYKRDDNSHIEQKNYTHVRQKLGYRRFDNIKIVELLNDLYKNEWHLYHLPAGRHGNFFLPSVKLIEKERVRSKVIKKHDKPKTPYQRVLDARSVDVPNSMKQKLTQQVESLNPFALKKIIDRKINNILKLAS